MTRIIICGISAVLGATACAPPQPPFEVEPRLERLRELAAEVDGPRALGDVTALVEAHQSDTALDCEAIGLAEDDRVCHHTREAAGALILSTLEALGASPRLEIEGEGTFTTRNIVVELPGTTRPEEIVLLGAHYDSFYGGADDNASGVAAMLELYRVLRAQTHARTVRFVWFDFEEFGFIGSQRYVQALPEGEQLVAALVFDCIGYADSRPGTQVLLPGFPTPSEGDFLAIIGNERSRQRTTEVYALNEGLQIMRAAAVVSPADGAFPIAGQLLRSDHSVFWLEGIPAVFVTDTAKFRNPHYHRETDLPATLDLTFFTNAIRLSGAAVAHWAGVE